MRAVVICGLMTSFCCETTARDAHGRDYEVLFVADATEGPDLEDAEGAGAARRRAGATMTALGAGFAEIVTQRRGDRPPRVSRSAAATER